MLMVKMSGRAVPRASPLPGISIPAAAAGSFFPRDAFADCRRLWQDERRNGPNPKRSEDGRTGRRQPDSLNARPFSTQFGSAVRVTQHG
jgi:hypothetical protein